MRGMLTDERQFVQVANRFLEDLTDTLDLSANAMFEEVVYSDGVLNIEMSDGRAYVLNK